jgi:ATP-dependent DNA helicase RecQ
MGAIISIVVLIILYNIIFGGNNKSSNSNYNKPPNNIHEINKAKNDLLKKTNSNYQNNNSTIKNDAQKQNIQRQEILFQSQILKSNENHFIPDPNIKFKILNEFGIYNWYALYNYYPVNRFSYNDLSQEDILGRRHTFDFKDGKAPHLYAEIFASALVNKYGKEYLKNKVILIIPASNKDKTHIRFSKFCQKLSELTGLINGYNYLTNNDLIREPAHTSGNRNYDLNSFIKVSNDIIDKDIIVIDDVRTSGSSSNAVYNLLKQKNVKSVTFLYLAKTISIN